MAQDPFLRPGERLRDLRALEAMHEQPDISQRDLAVRLGIAVGLVNACVRKMARKGWIKIKRVNSRNMSYSLTPAGFSEKAHLSLEFTGYTIGFYRGAKQTVSKTLGVLGAAGVRRALVLGSTDLAEIVTICSAPYEIEILGILRSGQEPENRLLLAENTIALEDAPNDGFDVLIVAELESFQELSDELKKLACGRPVAWPLEGRIESSEEVAE